MSDRPEPVIRHKPPREGGSVLGAQPAAVPATVPAARERMIPKPLQRVLGFCILFATVGVVSCQAFLD